MIVMLSELEIQLKGETLTHHEQSLGFSFQDHKSRPKKKIPTN